MSELNYPKLMKSKDGQVVLFLSEQKGVAMNSICAEFGETYNDWFLFNFKDFEDELIISNKIIKENE